MAAWGGFPRCIWWGAFLPPPGKVAMGLTCPGPEQCSVGSACPSQALKGAVQILRRIAHPARLCKRPLANLRCATSTELSVLWLIHTTQCGGLAGPGPGGSDALGASSLAGSLGRGEEQTCSWETSRSGSLSLERSRHKRRALAEEEEALPGQDGALQRAGATSELCDYQQENDFHLCDHQRLLPLLGTDPG